MPRAKPPFPVQKGLWGKPTIINNVETLANVPYIIRKGAAWYAAHGHREEQGARRSSRSPARSRTRASSKCPWASPLREIIYEIGGGIEGGKKLKAVQTGGPSGGCIPASMLDTDGGLRIARARSARSWAPAA